MTYEIKQIFIKILASQKNMRFWNNIVSAGGKSKKMRFLYIFKNIFVKAIKVVKKKDVDIYFYTMNYLFP